MENSVLIEKVTHAQLTDAINQAVKNQFDELKQKLHKVRNQEELLTREDAAKLLTINLSTLYLWTRKGKLPFFGIGYRVHYKRNALLILNFLYHFFLTALFPLSLPLIDK